MFIWLWKASSQRLRRCSSLQKRVVITGTTSTALLDEEAKIASSAAGTAFRGTMDDKTNKEHEGLFR